MMSVGYVRNTTHCASYETRVEEGWVHFISTSLPFLASCLAPRYRQFWALESDISCSIEKSRGLSQSFTPDYYIHQTLQVTSAMEAEITTPLEAIAHVIDSN